MTVRKAVERYLRRRRSDATESSVKSWKYRLKLFVEWCEGIGVDRVGDLRAYDLDEYYELRSSRVEPVTLEGEMRTLRTFLTYLDEQLDAVEDGLADAARVPDLDRSERASDASFRAEKAIALLEAYRESPQHRARRGHAFLEIAWHTGARQGSIRGLDVRDVDFEKECVEFRHRPDTDTPLKNKNRGERPVALPTEAMDVVREYVDDERRDVRDDYDRKPLLPSAVGRPTNNTLRNWSYMATEPCLLLDCPHDKEREACDWTEYVHASKCPSSRSPHRIRTGSITWQLNLGFPPEVVSERVNATVDVIENHYDWASREERWRRRHERMENRREYIDQLEVSKDE